MTRNPHPPEANSFIKANLIHLGCNMWADWENPDIPPLYEYARYKPFMRLDRPLWDDMMKAMVEHGFNMVVIDLGEGVKYESHPELAVKGSWSVSRLRKELDKIRKIGLEPIPKMNFSTAHNLWLGPYSRMVSTARYYQVVEDLIQEAHDLFDGPRLLHLGMDEETFQHQRWYRYAVVRQHDLWWEDVYHLFSRCEKLNMRPWVWSDYVWHHPELFYKKMPTSVLQSNWFYSPSLNRQNPRVRAYLDLQEKGYDQVPTGSNHSNPENIVRTAAWAKRYLSPESLKGLMQTHWRETLEIRRGHHMEAIEWAGKAFKILEK
ncbi:Tat pathway signal protein [bacterium]|nr:Tat pathway signal protein [bacterium]